MTTLGKRIKLARGTLSQEAFCALIGVSKGALGFYERDENLPKIDVISKICSETGVSLDWLVNGVGSMRPKTGEKEPKRALLKNIAFIDDVDGELIEIPLVEARLSAGHGSLETDDNVIRLYSLPSQFLYRKGNPSQMVLMTVSGDSMQPEIMDGDLVLLDQSRKDINVNVGRIFAVGFEDAIYLKRIDKEPGKIILRSVNKNYPPVEIDVRGQESDSFRVIGQVLWVGREY